MATATPLPDLDTDAEATTRRQPPYAVVLHNDDVNTVDFVVAVIRKVFGFPLEKAIDHTMEAHEEGRSVLWVGAREVAELKADQVHSCGPDPSQKKRGAQPLGVTVEPVA